MQTFQVHSDLFRSHQCTNTCPTNSEWYFIILLGHLHLVYRDDISLYSRTQEEAWYACSSLTIVLGYELYPKLKKCNFDYNQVQLLGYVVLAKGIYYGPIEGSNSFVLLSTMFNVWASMSIAICKFLQQILQELLEDHIAIEFTWKNQTFTWSSSVAKVYTTWSRRMYLIFQFGLQGHA